MLARELKADGLVAGFLETETLQKSSATQDLPTVDLSAYDRSTLENTRQEMVRGIAVDRASKDTLDSMLRALVRYATRIEFFDANIVAAPDRFLPGVRHILQLVQKNCLFTNTNGILCRIFSRRPDKWTVAETLELRKALADMVKDFPFAVIECHVKHAPKRFFHERYLVTDHAVLDFGCGFDVWTDSGQVNRETTVSLARQPDLGAKLRRWRSLDGQCLTPGL